MSAESAQIMKAIKEKIGGLGTNITLATVNNASPISLKVDDVSYDITTGILINQTMLSHGRSATLEASENNYTGTISLEGILSSGDRVAVALVSPSCTIILCKVVSA